MVRDSRVGWQTLAACLVGVLCLGLAGPGLAGQPEKAGKKLRVVVFGAHCDDPESGAGGLILLLTRGGHEVYCAYASCFRGQRAFFGRPEAEVRREESLEACRRLGAKPKFFPYAHEKLAVDDATVKQVGAWLLEIKPDVVVAHWPLDMHPNHNVASALVWQNYARSGGWNLYFFEVMTDRQTIGFRPDLYLDIGSVRDMKRFVLEADKSQGPEEIWKCHEAMHRRRGAECGVEYAEAYWLVEAKPGRPLLPVAFLSRKHVQKTGDQ